MKKLALTAMLFAASSAHAITIDFDSLAGNTQITNQFPEATFTSSAGQVRTIGPNPLAHSAPNFIIPHDGVRLNGFADLLVSFTDPVENLTFWSVGDNFNGQQALIDVFVNDLFATTVGLFGDGNRNGNTPDLQDLSAYSGVTSILIYSVTDPFGLAYDTFTFDLAKKVSVPEPGVAGLLGLCLAALGLFRRRRV